MQRCLAGVMTAMALRAPGKTILSNAAANPVEPLNPTKTPMDVEHMSSSEPVAGATVTGDVEEDLQ